MQPASVIARARGFTHLANQLHDWEEFLLSVPAPPHVADVADVVISVILPSGDILLEDLHQHPSETVSAIINIASSNLRVKGLPGSVCALCTIDGRALVPMDSILAAGLGDRTLLTAVISCEAESLRIIEGLFHDLIMEIAGCSGSPATLTDKGFTFPSLKVHVDNHGSLPSGNSREATEFYAVPGMHGGFSIHVVKEALGWKLTCNSFCRVCEGSGRTHEITVAGVREIQQKRTCWYSQQDEYLAHQDYKENLEELFAQLQYELQNQKDEDEHETRLSAWNDT